MIDPLRGRALAILREGRLTVVYARTSRDGGAVPDQLIVAVRSSRDGGGTYAIDFLDGVWTCTCRDGAQNRPCAHMEAARLVTGHHNLAAVRFA